MVAQADKHRRDPDRLLHKPLHALRLLPVRAASEQSEQTVGSVGEHIHRRAQQAALAAEPLVGLAVLITLKAVARHGDQIGLHRLQQRQNIRRVTLMQIGHMGDRERLPELRNSQPVFCQYCFFCHTLRSVT